jgi:hypothetical protein
MVSVGTHLLPAAELLQLLLRDCESYTQTRGHGHDHGGGNEQRRAQLEDKHPGLQVLQGEQWMQWMQWMQ